MTVSETYSIRWFIYLLTFMFLKPQVTLQVARKQLNYCYSKPLLTKVRYFYTPFYFYAR